MAVGTQILLDNVKWHVVNLTNDDGTVEAAVTKVDISTLSNTSERVPPTHLSLYKMSYMVSASSDAVALYFDATSDDPIVIVSQSGIMNFRDIGGIPDPMSAGFTGDINLTTIGFGVGSTYSLTLTFKKKIA